MVLMFIYSLICCGLVGKSKAEVKMNNFALKTLQMKQVALVAAWWKLLKSCTAQPLY